MGQVKYATGIDYVKGSLAKPVKKDGHNHGEYLIGTHREAETTNPNCTRLYIRRADTYVRQTPPSVDEIASRDLFAERAAWVKARAKALSTLSTDQANYLAQKDSADGAKTWKSYLWKLAKAAVTGEGE